MKRRWVADRLFSFLPSSLPCHPFCVCVFVRVCSWMLRLSLTVTRQPAAPPGHSRTAAPRPVRVTPTQVTGACLHTEYLTFLDAHTCCIPSSSPLISSHLHLPSTPFASPLFPVSSLHCSPFLSSSPLMSSQLHLTFYAFSIPSVPCIISSLLSFLHFLLL